MTFNLVPLAAATARSTALTTAAKRVSLAQALLESGRGSSALFVQHNNPYGMKYRARIASLATPVNYSASDGLGSYAAFATLEDAVAGYALFVRTGPYAAPEDDSAAAYLDTLTDGGYATDPAYAAKVTALLPEADALLASAVPASPSSGKSPAPSPSQPGATPGFTLGVIVGHNASDGGARAVAPLSVQEFAYNTDIAELMEALGPEYGIAVEVLFRSAGKGYASEIDEVYAMADALDVDATMELHFNAASPLARGTEVLSSGSAGSLALARAVQAELVDLYGRKGSTDRGVKVLGPADRGYRSVVAGRAPAILPEPFFGSNADEARLAVTKGKAALAEAYMRAARAYATALATAKAA